MQTTEPIKERFQKRLGSMQAPVVLAPAESVSEVALLKKHRLSGPEVVVEKAGRSQGDGDDFGVDECALVALLVPAGPEPIIDEAVHSNDRGVHGRSVREKVM
jgi:hypothetical protein